MASDPPRIETQALEQAIAAAGSQSELARRIGVSQNAVSRWMRINGQVGDRFAIKVEQATDGAVSRHDLRPDLYPRDPENTASGMEAVR